MSLRTRDSLKGWGKKIGLIIFALLFFLNIKIMFTDENELVAGDLSVFGIVVKLFEPTLADEPEPCPNLCHEIGCTKNGTKVCTIMLCNPGPGSYYCYYSLN
jgi:hypothetical protein